MAAYIRWPDEIEEMAFCEDSDRFLMCGDGEMTNTDHRRGAGHAGVMRPAGVRLRRTLKTLYPKLYSVESLRGN